jgi:hypothetical protein
MKERDVTEDLMDLAHDIVQARNGWRGLTLVERESLPFKPNSGAFHADAKRAALTSRRLREGHFAVSCRAVEYLLDAVHNERLREAFVVAYEYHPNQDRNGYLFRAVGIMEAAAFRRKAGKNIDGPHGPYWIVNDNMAPFEHHRPF